MKYTKYSCGLLPRYKKSLLAIAGMPVSPTAPQILGSVEAPLHTVYDGILSWLRPKSLKYTKYSFGLLPRYKKSLLAIAGMPESPTAPQVLGSVEAPLHTVYDGILSWLRPKSLKYTKYSCGLLTRYKKSLLAIVGMPVSPTAPQEP